MEGITISIATINDIDFITDTIVAAEKSSTDNFGLAKLFGVDEETMKSYIRAMLDEEVDGCEMSLSSFLVARHEGRPVAAFAGWVEGRNEDNMPSSLLKSNLIGYVLPQECLLSSSEKSDIVKPLQIEREDHSYQLEYSYTKPDFRGKGIMLDIIKAHVEQAVMAGCNKMQVHVFDNNKAAIRTYEKMGFEIKKNYLSSHPLTSEYFPSNNELLMEKPLKL